MSFTSKNPVGMISYRVIYDNIFSLLIVSLSLIPIYDGHDENIDTLQFP